jgi:hypothetical protein
MAGEGSQEENTVHRPLSSANRTTASQLESKSMPSPGRSPGWPERDTPSTSPRATTRRPENRATRARPPVTSRAAPGPARGRAAPGRRDATRTPGALWRSKPGANHLRALVTRRDTPAGTRRSSGTRWHQAAAADSPRPRSGRSRQGESGGVRACLWTELPAVVGAVDPGHRGRTPGAAGPRLPSTQELCEVVG